MKKGIFITMEGGEGCGKTTQLKKLSQRLVQEGYPAVTTREPGGCPISEHIRKILLNPAHENLTPTAEFFLFLAARAQHVTEVVMPALEKGWVVISDRFMDSTYVYQQQVRKCVDARLFAICHQYALNTPERFCAPDMTMILDVDVAIGHQRALDRNHHIDDQSEARFDNEKLEFHTRVNEEFRTLATTEGPSKDSRYILIDANRSIDEIHESIYQEVKNHIRRVS